MLATVRDKLTADPGPSSKSLCHVALEERLSYRTAHKLHPYCIRTIHKLLPAVNHRRMSFCKWFLDSVNAEHSIPNDIFYFDEVWFSLKATSTATTVTCGSP